ncbi:hypothetical protein FCL47_12505 [Desulfopila sp. IMCC35006]|uniref:hypothetical protein n=1 Tax=Desulfopila sp. IMCC35006 TaxID=2569542 RepID=UPI0010AC0091|nr:hypothetical protein [Desulfopila sp. IMCC35006]TKB25906.1 hypothetical protein FCL47_12505 [Desulfopila sp. IMCC35006]
MFLNQEMKKIQEAKNRMAICCDLRRQLVHVEVHGIRSGMFNTGSNLTLGLTLIEQILGFIRERKGTHS